MSHAARAMITQGWSGAQRRALRNSLTPEQVRIVINRIRFDQQQHLLDPEEANAAVDFAAGVGDPAYGIVEYISAVLFGRDPVFKERWQEIRKSENV